MIESRVAKRFSPLLDMAFHDFLTSLEAELQSAGDALPILLHPNLSEHYRGKIAGLTTTLNRPLDKTVSAVSAYVSKRYFSKEHTGHLVNSIIRKVL